MEAKKERVLIAPDRTIRETMIAIDEGTLGIALVVDANRRLLGVATDGDIRRATLKGASLETPISEIMNRTPVSVPQAADMQAIRQIMLKDDIKQIPVVDDQRRVIDIITMSSLLKVPLSNPDITAREIQAVLDVLSTPDLSLGPKLFEFESKMAQYAGTQFAVAVNSGTSALHLCVKSLGISDGDEIITTPFSFIASANCALFERAVPVFVDIDPKTLNIDPRRIEEKITRRTKAILPVHVFGQPCDLGPIMDIARRRGLAVIEDACEAIGAEYYGKRVGTFGDCAVFSFYPNKQMTMGEGGVIVTNRADLASLCRSYRNQGRSETGGWLAHERLGYNYRLGELHCALGVVQLDRLKDLLEKRRTVAEQYNQRLSRVKGLCLPAIVPGTVRSWFVYVVQLEKEAGGQRERDEILKTLRSQGISCSNYFAPIHLQPFYRDQFGFKEDSFPITEGVSQRTIALPFFNHLKTEDVERVCDALEKCLERVSSVPR